MPEPGVLIHGADQWSDPVIGQTRHQLDAGLAELLDDQRRRFCLFVAHVMTFCARVKFPIAYRDRSVIIGPEKLSREYLRAASPNLNSGLRRNDATTRWRPIATGSTPFEPLQGEKNPPFPPAKTLSRRNRRSASQ